MNPVSRLMLGTAQWGIPYGLANRAGQPGYPQVRAMVEAAFKNGVTAFDTAAAYGESEAVVGRALRDLGIADRVHVVTKVKSLNEDELRDPQRAERCIENSVAESRKRLGLTCLPTVLFHREADAHYLPVLAKLKERGWLREAGVSCGSDPETAAAWLGKPAVNALQVPASLLDPRHIRAGVCRKARKAGVSVFVRSLYLQGLLLMPEPDIPSALSEVIPVRRRIEKLAAEAGMGVAELAVRHMLAQDGVSALVVGVETLEQVRDNIAWVRRGPLDADWSERLAAAVPELPDRILTPSRWPR